MANARGTGLEFFSCTMRHCLEHVHNWRYLGLIRVQILQENCDRNITKEVVLKEAKDHKYIAIEDGKLDILRYALLGDGVNCFQSLVYALERV